MALRTPLYARHVELGARMVDFGGWDMPLHYGSQLEEHHVVRRDAGVFDVSHMCPVDLRGARVREYLRYLLANDVAKLVQPGKALYSCMLNDRGGVVDDLIVYYLDEQWFRMVVNAGTAPKDLAWLRQHAEPYGVTVTDRRDLAMLAVQGPNARTKALSLLPQAERDAALLLDNFYGRAIGGAGSGTATGDWFVARTGYTGEDGFEVMLPAGRAVEALDALLAAGVKPAGLGARDTLRLEAGMNLYGSDMDEAVTPLESGLAWTVAMRDERPFIGRDALAAQKAAGVPRRQVGLLLEDKGVLRGHQRVVTPAGDGEITSGTYSPTLERSVALARIPPGTFERVQVDVRGKLLNARIVKPPFVRHGQPVIAL
jgi:aminomethyltransferase